MTTLTATMQKIDRKKVAIFFLDHAIEVILVLMVLVLALNVHGFWTWGNWMNILRANSLKGVIAFGMTMVIICGLIDLSIGSTVALSGVIVARMCRDLTAGGMDLTTAALLGLMVSLSMAFVVGYLHGYFIHKTSMPAFIVTLVSLNVLYGIAGIISQGFPIANQFPQWFNVLGGGRLPIDKGIVSALNATKIDGIPYPAVILLAAFFIVFFIMKYTTIGRSIYATGGNPESARLSGINTFRTKVFALIGVQILAVISGFMTSGQVLAGSFSFGRGWELDVISAVIIGGTAFSGGIGTVWGTLLGVIFMGVISNGMTLLNFDIYTQYVVRGLIMGLAVLISSAKARIKA